MGRLLAIEDLVVEYPTLSGPVLAVDGVSLDVEEGEWVSIVGESGSGKSTLATAIIGLVPPPGRVRRGRILFEGVNILTLNSRELKRIRGRRIGMIFQDPLTSLDPLRRVGDQIAEAILEHGLASSKREALRMAGEALERVGIPRDRVDYYPHQLSGGQRQRVAIASAIALEPRLLIADEPTTALDVIVQANIMRLLNKLRRDLGMSILFITHDIALAVENSDRIAVMYAGKLVEYSPTEDLVEDPLHPYTKGLLESAPDLWGPKRLYSIPGQPPDMRKPPRGCRFHPRCPLAVEECSRVEPGTFRFDRRIVSCILYREGGEQWSQS
ncbi:MAG: ABC transporter ATP-binding protein [Desulfurococcales archaeon]|nr:ABC transporter ATP-binding protein [Desulfurococcales archaeon]